MYIINSIGVYNSLRLKCTYSYGFVIYHSVGTFYHDFKDVHTMPGGWHDYLHHISLTHAVLCIQVKRNIQIPQAY